MRQPLSLRQGANSSSSLSSPLYDLCVFIGRFQPFHNGHLAVVREALAYGRYAAILLGSAGDPRRPDYIPFTEVEREEMIRACLTSEENARLFVIPIQDSAYNLNDWVTRVYGAVVDTLDDIGMANRDSKVALIGHAKDNSSYYLKLFPKGRRGNVEWDSVNVKNYMGLSATPFRLQYFSEDVKEQERALLNADGYVPDAVIDWLWRFRESPDYAEMVSELAFVKKYRSAWDAAPYPPTFITTDAFVVQSGNILLIQRKARPGKGLWALPGGFLNQDERIIDGIIRELKEETSIKVPVPVLKGSMVGDPIVFDHPFRSSRGRVVTHAGIFHLEGTTELPKIRAADDAADARWWPLAEVRRDMMFEDHYSMIQNLRGKI
jgi:bifunctional NMN adenylyltransferase/nudix hydrolase